MARMPTLANKHANHANDDDDDHPVAVRPRGAYRGGAAPAASPVLTARVGSRPRRIWSSERSSGRRAFGRFEDEPVEGIPEAARLLLGERPEEPALHLVGRRDCTLEGLAAGRCD